MGQQVDVLLPFGCRATETAAFLLANTCFRPFAIVDDFVLVPEVADIELPDQFHKLKDSSPRHIRLCGAIVGRCGLLR